MTNFKSIILVLRVGFLFQFSTVGEKHFEISFCEEKMQFGPLMTLREPNKVAVLLYLLRVTVIPVSVPVQWRRLLRLC